VISRRACAAVLAAGVAFAVAACTGNQPLGADTRPSVPAPPSSPGLTAVPSLTGSPAPPGQPPPITASIDPRSVAGQAAKLGQGPAHGTIRLLLNGLGEVESAVSGQCTQGGEGLTVALTSAQGTAVEVIMGTATSAVSVHDAGLSQKSTLLPGDYAIAPPRLKISTTLRPEGADSPGGRLDLDVACGG